MRQGKTSYTIIALTSITYAIKAKKMLNSYGHYCEIVRTPKSLAKGCGYSIRINTDVKTVLPLLAAEQITVKDYVSE